ncbi:MAG: RNA polymerase sigma factor [Pseudonocardiaceae bacterium]
MADEVRPSRRARPGTAAGSSADGGRSADEPADVELVVRMSRQDGGSALAELYGRYGRPCYSLARRICADDGLAEDVVQEVFLALWRDPGRFDPSRGGFATWLLTLIHHKSVDAVRRESTIRRRTVPAPEAGEDWSPNPVPGADQAAMARVAAGQVRDALHRLPAEQRQALALAYYGGHTQREVAALIGVPLGTVKSRMFAGVKRLRTLLEPENLMAELRRAQEVGP